MTIQTFMVLKDAPVKNGLSATRIHFYIYNFRLDKRVKDVHIIDADEELVQEKRVIVLS